MKKIEETNEIELTVGDTVVLPCGRVTRILEFETWDKDGKARHDLITLVTSTCRRDARVGVIPSEKWAKIMPNDPKVMFYFPYEVTKLRPSPEPAKKFTHEGLHVTCHTTRIICSNTLNWGNKTNEA